MSLSLSPNSFYRQTTDCTEGSGLTREHCILVTLWRSVLLVEEAGVPGENHQPAAGH